MGTTLAEKVWADHLVRKGSDGAPDLLYIDLMLMHEVTSPQAFEGLRLAGRKPRHVDQLIATEDHNTPTVDIDRPNPDETSALQLTTLEKNCKEFGVRLHPLGDADQGIVHAFAPILGLTQPGMTIVCGDSHTSTHGAFGAMAIGIGTSEVEHVMATQTLSLKPFKTMAVNIEGDLPKGVTAKDIILAIIAKIGTGGGQGHVIEYRGEAIKKLSMDARMTICNMSIEAGARAGMIAPDEVTFEYLKGRPHAPEGEMWDKAIEIVHTLGRSKGLPGEYRMRAVQAEQYFLEEAGRSKEAEQLNDLLDRLEDQYADEEIDENSDDVVIDHDLEDITDDSDVLEKLGIDPDEAQYAPDPEQEYGDEDDEAEDGDAESDEADETETDSANDAEADDSAESADSDSTEPETEE